MASAAAVVRKSCGKGADSGAESAGDAGADGGQRPRQWMLAGPAERTELRAAIGAAAAGANVMLERHDRQRQAMDSLSAALSQLSTVVVRLEAGAAGSLAAIEPVEIVGPSLAS